MTKKINFSKFSSIKIGAEIDVFMIDSKEDCNSPQVKSSYLIGSCNNILIGNTPPPLSKLSKKFDYIKIQDEILHIGAATPTGKIASFCKKNNIANFEFLSHLPGTLGGAVYMNAGLKEFEIFEYLHSITTCDKALIKDEIEFRYRYTNINSTILEARFEIQLGFDETKVEMFKKMRSNQPNTPSAGSCFKNPKGDYAGRLIEAVGLKGKRVGDMEFSEIHANFLVNHSDGTFEDAMHLIDEVQKKVKEEFGIELELEIKILEV